MLEKVVNLGNFGDIVKVKDGYVCNFLILNCKVCCVMKEVIVEFEVCCVEFEKIVVEKLVVL